MNRILWLKLSVKW